MKQTYNYQNKPFSIDLAQSGKTYSVILDGKTYSVEVTRVDGERLDLLIDGVATSAYVSKDGGKRWVTVNGQTLVLTNSNEARKSAGHSSHPANQLVAQMPGLVRAVAVEENDPVVKGQTLAIIEAMKMENKVAAPFDGQVKKLLIRVGQTVEREQILMELTRIDPAVNHQEPGPDPA